MITVKGLRLSSDKNIIFFYVGLKAENKSESDLRHWNDTSFPLLDPPRIYSEDLSAFTEPLPVKVGHNAIFKVHFVGHEPIKVRWYKEGEELRDDGYTKIEKCRGQSRLLLSRCHRKDTGEIKIKLKNEHGFTEATTQLMVLGEWRKRWHWDATHIPHWCFNTNTQGQTNSGRYWLELF